MESQNHRRRPGVVGLRAQHLASGRGPGQRTFQVSRPLGADSSGDLRRRARRRRLGRRPCTSGLDTDLSRADLLQWREVGYQLGMEWTREGGSWSYRDCPVRDLLDGWRFDDDVPRLDPDFARRAPVLGRLAGSIAPSEVGVRYTLELTNSSQRRWTDVFWWLCLNHYQSRVTGYRPHFRVGSSWVPAQEMRGRECTHLLPGARHGGPVPHIARRPLSRP